MSFIDSVVHGVVIRNAKSSELLIINIEFRDNIVIAIFLIAVTNVSSKNTVPKKVDAGEDYELEEFSRIS